MITLLNVQDGTYSAVLSTDGQLAIDDGDGGVVYATTAVSAADTAAVCEVIITDGRVVGLLYNGIPVMMARI